MGILAGRADEGQGSARCRCLNGGADDADAQRRGPAITERLGCGVYSTDVSSARSSSSLSSVTPRFGMASVRKMIRFSRCDGSTFSASPNRSVPISRPADMLVEPPARNLRTWSRTAAMSAPSCHRWRRGRNSPSRPRDDWMGRLRFGGTRRSRLEGRLACRYEADQ